MIISVMGFIGSGKDTVANHIASRNDFVRDSFAASLKDACSVIFDWPRHLLEGDTKESREWRETSDTWWAEKLGYDNFTPRYALQYIGTEIMRETFHDSIWLLTLQHRLETKYKGKNIIVSDCRFENEIEFFKTINGKLIFVDNGIRPEWFNIAKDALFGDSKAVEYMYSKYSYIHRSEWDWVNSTPDLTIMNDFAIKNKDSYDQLIQRIDNSIDKLIKLPLLA